VLQQSLFELELRLGVGQLRLGACNPALGYADICPCHRLVPGRLLSGLLRHDAAADEYLLASMIRPTTMFFLPSDMAGFSIA